MKLYSRYARLVRWAVRRTALRDWRAEPPEKRDGEPWDDGPAVYVVHHQNLLGPVCAVALLPSEVHVWALYVFCGRSCCFRQYYTYTFTQRFGWPKPAAFAAAGFLSLLIPPLLSGLGAIPVYRGLREIRATMDRSVEALLAGESILICPDREYAETSAHMGEIYKGFLRLDPEYFKRTGKHLNFIPLMCDGEKRLLSAGRAVRFSGTASFFKEREEVAARLVQAVNRLAHGC